MKVLYLTYDGLTDPLGQSQIIPYVVGLARLGHQIHVISFEKPSRLSEFGTLVADILQKAEISWEPLSYTKRPPILSTVWDIARLRRAARKAQLQRRFHLTHCRSYIPALVGLSLRLKFGVPFLFDMRGFWPDEKVEVGAWPASNPVYAFVYRYFKRQERVLLVEAGGVVVLTSRGKEDLERRFPALRTRVPVSVIPCCVDFSEFFPDTERGIAARHSLTIPRDAFVLAYVGSLGTWYMLPQMMDFFAYVRCWFADARFLLLTTDSPEQVFRAASDRDVPADAVIVRSVARRHVPEILSAANAGISFIRPLASKISSSPTKIGEYLALGLPVVANTGIGDVDDILARLGVGVSLTAFSATEYERAIRALDTLRLTPSTEIHQRAKGVYDMNAATNRFNEMYRLIGEQQS